MGASFRSPEAHAEWVKDQNFGYEIWTDASRALAMQYGAAKSKKTIVPGRVTVILDAQGDLLLEYQDGTASSSHPQEVLEDCQAIFGE